MKNLLLIVSLVLFNKAFAQEVEPAEPVTLIVHTNGINKPRLLEIGDFVTITFRDLRSPVRGEFIKSDDSTFSIKDHTVPLKEIESIRISNRTSQKVGIVVGIIGVALIVPSTVILLESQNLSTFNDLFGVLIGGAGIAFGSSFVAISVILLSTATKKYKLNKWHLINPV